LSEYIQKDQMRKDVTEIVNNQKYLQAAKSSMNRSKYKLRNHSCFNKYTSGELPSLKKEEMSIITDHFQSVDFKKHGQSQMNIREKKI
jgi:hypothetical protein